MGSKANAAYADEQNHRDAVIPPWWVDYRDSTTADIRPVGRTGHVLRGLEPSLAAALVATANAHTTPPWLELVRPTNGDGARYVVPGRVDEP